MLQYKDVFVFVMYDQLYRTSHRCMFLFHLYGVRKNWTLYSGILVYITDMPLGQETMALGISYKIYQAGSLSCKAFMNVSFAGGASGLVQLPQIQHHATFHARRYLNYEQRSEGLILGGIF